MKPIHTLILAAVLGGANLMAQSNDVAFLFGFSQRNASIRDGVIEGEVRLSVQFTAARLLKKGSAGRLYAELPVMTAAGLNGRIADNITGRIGGVSFVVPGLRYQFNPTPRLGVYVAGGVGLAVARQRIGAPSGQQVLTTKKTYWSEAANYAVGVDFGLTRRWSLRAEARDFRSRRETKVPGRNMGVQAGFAVRF